MIIFLNIINLMVFQIEMQRIFCEVGNEFSIIKIKIGLKFTKIVFYKI
jgi:hypothetical protein